MMLAPLRRFARFGDEGIAGHLYIGPMRLATLENPWRDNEPFVSCVPAGRYTLRKNVGGRKYPESWALIGETVGFDQSDGLKRWRCVFHVGNLVENTEGCPLLGEAHGFIGGRFALLESRKAYNRFLEALDWEPDTEVLIEDCYGGWD